MDSEGGLDKFLSQHKLPLFMGLVGLVLLVGGLVSSGLIPKTFVKSTKSGQVYSQSSVVSPSEMKVDVSGEVFKPGVYALGASSRVEDAIKAAGGVTESADPVYLSQSVNLAQKISDGMKIYIPRAGEAGQSGTPASTRGEPVVAGAFSQAKLVNINTAGLAELDVLSGVGPVTAQKIIDNRPYGSIEELLTKKAVTKSVYEKIKSSVSTY